MPPCKTEWLLLMLFHFMLCTARRIYYFVYISFHFFLSLNSVQSIKYDLLGEIYCILMFIQMCTFKECGVAGVFFFIISILLSFFRFTQHKILNMIYIIFVLTKKSVLQFNLNVFHHFSHFFTDTGCKLYLTTLTNFQPV